MILFLQLFVIFCFVIVIIALFREKTDFLTYSVAAMLAAATATFIFSPEPFSIDEFILSIDWSIIFFLISLFYNCGYFRRTTNFSRDILKNNEKI